MRIHSRLKRLERKSDADNKTWVVFSVNSYENAMEEEETKRCLIDAYLSNGGRAAACYLFVNEAP